MVKHGIYLFCLHFRLLKRPRDQLLAQGLTRKDVDVVFLFNSYPGLGQEPASFNA